MVKFNRMKLLQEVEIGWIKAFFFPLKILEWFYFKYFYSKYVKYYCECPPLWVFYLFGIWGSLMQDLTLEVSPAWNVPVSCLHLWSLELQVQATYHI